MKTYCYKDIIVCVWVETNSDNIDFYPSIVEKPAYSSGLNTSLYGGEWLMSG